MSPLVTGNVNRPFATLTGRPDALRTVVHRVWFNDVPSKESVPCLRHVGAGSGSGVHASSSKVQPENSTSLVAPALCDNTIRPTSCNAAALGSVAAPPTAVQFSPSVLQ